MINTGTDNTNKPTAGTQALADLAYETALAERKKEEKSKNGTLNTAQQGNPLQLFAFLIAFFAGIKDDSGEGMASNSAVQSMSSAFGIDFSNLSKTVKAVRSGEESIFSAARKTFSQIQPSKVDFAKAEATVAKYAESGNPLLEMIAKKESGGNYNIAYNGTAKGMTGSFTSMTVNEVLAWQKNHTAVEGFKSSAVGKYQIIRTTLEGLKKEFAAKGEDIGNQKFDEKMQDRLAESLLNRRGYKDYLAGKMDESTFMARLSKEWAALPKDMSGAGSYDKDGLNKAHVDPATMLVAMRAVKDPVYQSDLRTQFASGGKPESSPPASGTQAFTLAMNTGGTNETLKSEGPTSKPAFIGFSALTPSPISTGKPA